MRLDLVIQALANATFIRKYHCTGTIFYTERVSQFTSGAVVNQCNELGLIRCMRATGSCYDRTSAESFWSIFKHKYY